MFLRGFQNADDVGSLPALGQADDHRVLQVRFGFIESPYRGRGKGNRDAELGLTQVFTVHCRVIGRASSGNHAVLDLSVADVPRDGNGRLAVFFKTAGNHGGLLRNLRRHPVFGVERGSSSVFRVCHRISPLRLSSSTPHCAAWPFPGPRRLRTRWSGIRHSRRP